MKYKDHYSREYNYLVRARFSSSNLAKRFMWDIEDYIESEQEDNAEDWLRFFVKSKSGLFNLFKMLTNNENVEYFELEQK